MSDLITYTVGGVIIFVVGFTLSYWLWLLARGTWRLLAPRVPLDTVRIFKPQVPSRILRSLPARVLPVLVVTVGVWLAGVWFAKHWRAQQPKSYAECVLAHVKPAMTQSASAAVCRACREKFPAPAPISVSSALIDGTLEGDYQRSLYDAPRWSGTCTVRLFNKSDTHLSAVDVRLTVPPHEWRGKMTSETVDDYRVPVSIGPHAVGAATFKVINEWNGSIGEWSVVGAEGQEVEQ